MKSEFTAILQKLVTEQSKEVLLNAVKCKAFLADYTRGEYKKESRILLQAIEAGVSKQIYSTVELEICKKQQVRELNEEYGLTEEIAIDIVDTLALILKRQESIKSQNAICKKCGKELQKEWKVCPYCGTAVMVQQNKSPTLNSASMKKSTSTQNYSAESDFKIKCEENEIKIIKYIGFESKVCIPPYIQKLPVTNIGDNAFFNCTELTSVTIPDIVICIERWAFSGCTSLTNIIIPNSVISIGEYAFALCSNLTSITIGNGVTSIEKAVFPGCINLISVSFLGNINSANFSKYSFIGDLRKKYITGGRGTYTRANGGTTWRKQ